MLRLVALHRARVHPDLSVNHAHREAADIIGEGVEGAAAGEVEPRVVPVAGEDAVADAAPVQRKPHVGTAVIHRIHLAIVVHHGDGMPAAGHNPAGPVPEIINRPGPYLSFNYRSHAHPSRSGSRPTIYIDIMIIVDCNGGLAQAQPGRGIPLCERRGI